MPPKKKTKSARELREQLKKKEAEAKELKAKVALLEQQKDPSRGTSPTEQVQMAASVKRAKTKKGARKSAGSPVIDPLKATKDMISVTIVEPVFAIQKFAKGDGTQHMLASFVLLHGRPGHGMTQSERTGWCKEFGNYCASELNRHRSTVQSSIKKEFRAIWDNTNPKVLIPLDRWEACLNRDLDLNSDRDLADFAVYCDKIMAKATGTKARWNEEHRGYFCLFNGKPPNGKRPIDLYVTPETEAYGMLIIAGNWSRWTAQFQVTDKYPKYKQKPITHLPSVEVLNASTAIKRRLFLEQNPTIDPLNLPNDWEDSMKCNFELADGNDSIVRFFVVFALIICCCWPFINPILAISVNRIILLEVQKPNNAAQKWASLIDSVFNNPYTKATSGQQEYTGLTPPGEAKYKEYLAAVTLARKDKDKRKFEKDYLVVYQERMDIQCSTYKDDVKRRKRADPQDGIATDSPEEQAYDDSHLYPDELEEVDDDMEE